MCKAVEDMLNEREEKGVAQGIETGTLMTLIRLVKNGLLTIKDAAIQANMPEDAFKQKMAETSK